MSNIICPNPQIRAVDQTPVPFHKVRRIKNGPKCAIKGLPFSARMGFFEKSATPQPLKQGILRPHFIEK